MRKFDKLWIALLIVVGLTQVTMGQQAVPLGTSQNVMSKLKSSTSSTARVVAEVDLAISGTESLKGKVNFKESNGSSEFLVGEIKGVKDASFFIKASTQSLEGHIIIKSTEKAYKYYSDASGNAFVKEVDIHELICINYEDMPKAEKDALSTKEADVVVSEALLNLQSLPGAAGCVLLDFDGYYMPAGNYWNNGNAINAAASGMSDAAVREHWEVVSEDYRPFNVNITTNEGVFNSYPKNRRMRVVVTPTNTAAPGAGGVAYIGSFNWNNDVPCWVFITSGKSGGDASSHEIGHCFDLQHDGRSNPNEGYFLGIDGTPWAPIMGAGYYRPVVQWSKGEYRYAKNDQPGVLQDDIAVIASSKFGVGFRGDDYSNGTSGASTLTTNGSSINQKNGVIENAADWDFFKFTTGGGNVIINANTLAKNGNLDIIMRLYNASGAEIGSFTNGGANDLNASMNVNLAAGTYYVSIDGTGWGDPAYGGYSTYGSIGSYSITGTIPPGGSVNPSTGIVTAYKDCNYGGFSGGLAVGDYTLSQLNAIGILNDDISSLRVAEGFKAVLYADDNFSGASIEITSDNSCLVAAGWNDRASSLRIKTNGLTNQAGTYCLQNRVSGLFLDVVGGTGNMTNGANVQQWYPTAANNQQFELSHLGDGLYKIVAVHSGKSLDINNFSKNDGANLEQYPYNATPNQQFVIVNAGNGFVKLIAKHSAKVIEVSNFSTAPEANVQQWANVNQTSGHWKIIKPTTGITTVYRDCNYGGFYGGFGVGNYTQRQLATAGVKDNDISSLKIASGYKVILYADDNFGGASIEYTTDNSCVVANGWNDRASSMKVLAITTTPTNQAPNVTLTAPSNGASYNAPANIVITANASDADGSITKVEFYNGSTKLGEDATAPYSLTWSNVSAGTYSITAKAFDNKNATKTSGAATVKVNTVTTNACSGLPTYSENNGYQAGSKVKNAGRQFECKEWPYSGWCNGASWAYAPGTGLYWQDAWYDKGSCAARSSSDQNSTSVTAVNELLIAPNPVSNELNLQAGFDLSNGTIQIVNALGTRVMIVEDQVENIDVSALSAGVYTLIYSKGDVLIQTKFVK